MSVIVKAHIQSWPDMTTTLTRCAFYWGTKNITSHGEFVAQQINDKHIEMPTSSLTGYDEFKCVYLYLTE